MPRPTQLALIFLIALAGCGRNPTPAPEPPTPAPIAPAVKPVDKTAPTAASLQAQKEAKELDDAMAPYIKKGQETYPDAKKVYLKGLDVGHSFVVLTRLKDETGAAERVFVTVNAIDAGRITGTIVGPIRVVKGFKQGSEHSMPETEVLDWLIVHPDGSQEGNVVGIFLEEWEKTRPGK